MDNCTVLVFCQCCRGWIIYSIGETLVGIWEEDFKTTAAQASIVQSLLAGFYLLAGIIFFIQTLFFCLLIDINSLIN